MPTWTQHNKATWAWTDRAPAFIGRERVNWGRGVSKRSGRMEGGLKITTLHKMYYQTYWGEERARRGARGALRAWVARSTVLDTASGAAYLESAMSSEIVTN